MKGPVFVPTVSDSPGAAYQGAKPEGACCARQADVSLKSPTAEAPAPRAHMFLGPTAALLEDTTGLGHHTTGVLPQCPGRPSASRPGKPETIGRFGRQFSHGIKRYISGT